MAGSNSNAPIVGIYTKIQEIIAEYISGLENIKIEESKLAVKKAEEARVLLENAENGLKKSEQELSALESSKNKVKEEIESLDSSKKEKEDGLSALKSELVKEQSEVSALSGEATKIASEVANKKEELKSSMESKRKYDEAITVLAGTLSAKQLLVDDTEQNIARLSKELEIINSKIATSKLQNENLIEENKKLVLAKEGNTNAVKKSSEELVEFNKSLETQLIEINVKKKVAQNDLNSILEEIKTHKSSLASEKQAIENELLFIKQMNEMNAQKNKSYAYVKEKLKEIITKSILEVDEVKASEFKALLFVIEKL